MKELLALALLFILCSTDCVNRQDAINRAMEWVNAHVPYDKNNKYKEYVMGCEGIVGYGWQFPKPGIPSWDLIPKGYCRQVSKNELEKGDILVCPNEHELLFESWANSDRTSYYGIEESGGSGSVRRPIPYPYFPNYNPGCYIPCKVVKACFEENLSVE